MADLKQDSEVTTGVSAAASSVSVERGFAQLGAGSARCSGAACCGAPVPAAPVQPAVVQVRRRRLVNKTLVRSLAIDTLGEKWDVQARRTASCPPGALAVASLLSRKATWSEQI